MITFYTSVQLKITERKTLHFAISFFALFLISFQAIAQSPATVSLAATGATTYAPTGANNFTLYDNGGSGANYTNSANGYLVIPGVPGQTITIQGSYAVESGYDYVKIFANTAPSGTVVLNSSTSTSWYKYTAAAGQALTVQLTSDG